MKGAFKKSQDIGFPLLMVPCDYVLYARGVFVKEEYQKHMLGLYFLQELVNALDDANLASTKEWWCYARPQTRQVRG